MTVLVKNNINLLMQQSVQYFSLSHLSPTQTNWMVPKHVTYNRSCEKHDMFKSQPHTDLLFLPATHDMCIVCVHWEISGQWKHLANQWLCRNRSVIVHPVLSVVTSHHQYLIIILRIFHTQFFLNEVS
jgi:hypothetical protein